MGLCGRRLVLMGCAGSPSLPCWSGLSLRPLLCGLDGQLSLLRGSRRGGGHLAQQTPPPSPSRRPGRAAHSQSASASGRGSRCSPSWPVLTAPLPLNPRPRAGCSPYVLLL